MSTIDVYEFKNDNMIFEKSPPKGDKTIYFVDYADQSSFESFMDTPENECGLIKAVPFDVHQLVTLPIIPDTKRASTRPHRPLQSVNNIHAKRSCDLITSPTQIVGGIQKMGILEQLYSEHPAVGYWTSYKVNVQELLQKTMNNLLELTTHLATLLKSDVREYNYAAAFVYHVNAHNKKFIIIGDIHGNYHTLYRHVRRLVRAEILDESMKIKSPEHMIIFTGDLVGYGKFSIPVLYLVSVLMLANPNLVFCIKGNHEIDIEFQETTFKNRTRPVSFWNTEISGVLIYNQSLYTLITTSFVNKLFNFYKIAPSALLLEYSSNNKIWVSHGGIPFNVFKNECVMTNFDEIKVHSGNIPPNIKGIYYISSPIIAKSIYFADYGNFKYLENKRVGGIYIPDYELAKFMVGHNIQFIIRGHYDTHQSTILFNDQTPLYSEPIGNLTNSDVVFNNTTANDTTFGPVVRFLCDRIKWKKHIPVLTLTTAINPNKKVTYDSLAILRNDIPLSDLQNFNMCELMTKHKTVMSGGYLLFSNKFVKYKSRTTRD